MEREISIFRESRIRNIVLEVDFNTEKILKRISFPLMKKYFVPRKIELRCVTNRGYTKSSMLAQLVTEIGDQQKCEWIAIKYLDYFMDTKAQEKIEKNIIYRKIAQMRPNTIETNDDYLSSLIALKENEKDIYGSKMHFTVYIKSFSGQDGCSIS